MTKSAFLGTVTGFALGTLVLQGVVFPAMGVRTVFCNPERFSSVQK